MRSARRPLEFRDGLIWLEAELTSSSGQAVLERLVLDTATSNTCISVELAERLGYPEAKKLGTATFDTPHGPVLGYTIRIPCLSVLGRPAGNRTKGNTVCQAPPGPGASSRRGPTAFGSAWANRVLIPASVQ
jgi:hypothetical protein